MNKKIKKFLNLFGGEENITKVDYSENHLYVSCNVNKVDLEGLKKNKAVVDVNLTDKCEVTFKGNALEHYDKFEVLGKEKLAKPLSKEVYVTAKTWQIALFSMNNASTNCYMLLMNYVSYYAVGVAGLLTTTVGFLLTAMRLWDGITDPIIGFFIDKTDGKFGKFRPFIILGNIILAVMSWVIYHTTHMVPENMRLLYFIGCYLIYIVGYTFQTACTKAGQTCITNNPTQRPVFSMFDSVFTMVAFMGGTILATAVLLPMHGNQYSTGFFSQFHLITVIISAVLMIFAVIGIWSHDRTEFFGTGNEGPKVEFKDYWRVIKSNRALQMLVVSASTDKLASTVRQNTILTTIFFGILVGDMALSGTLSAVIMIPGIFLGLWGMNVSRKVGMKKVMVWSSWAGIVGAVLQLIWLLFADVTQLSLTNIGFVTISYFAIQIIYQSLGGISQSIVIPMIADCTDYETYKSGKYVPGMMGTLFSFVDKLISSLATSVVSLAVAAIGYTATLPQIGEPATPALLWCYIFLAVGLPLFGLICNVIAMHFYPLDKEKMEEIQLAIADIKKSAD
ncbi:MAG: MFS transporter [Erysipelotrichaceae bacterium]|nr:MFS transporter [Erysipelotrichaceae bacterium]